MRLEQNRGKTESIQAGLQLVSTEHVCLLDADLQSLTASEVREAVTLAVWDPTIDMIILRRTRAAVYAKITRGDVLFSGERILGASDLRRVLEMDLGQYQLEIAINQFMMDHRRRVYWMPSSAQNTLKVEKVGWMTGLEQEVFMIKNVLNYGGMGTYVKQLLGFAREQAPDGHARLPC